MHRVWIAVTVLLLTGTSANAQFQGPATGEGMTVLQAKSARDDSIVTLIGRVTSRISDDDYMFRDATGEIPVGIDDQVWRGQNVSPDKEVRISGEVDHERNGVRIDVRALELVQ